MAPIAVPADLETLALETGFAAKDPSIWLRNHFDI
jgi:hypothetical protein